MTDTNEKQLALDLDTLTDDEILQLTDEQIATSQSFDPSGEVALSVPVSEEITPDDPENTETETPETGAEHQQEEEAERQPEANTANDGEELRQETEPTGAETPAVAEEAKGDKPAEVAPVGKLEGGKETSEAKLKAEAKDATKASEAQKFFDIVSAPFKADGKDFTVKTPEDAIRLMQQGVNYSRRMAEMKPTRELAAMLQTHGLNDTTKLSELIDIHLGKPEAIQKLLKDKNIDPLDVDTTAPTTYVPTDHRGDTKDLDFRDAISRTMAAEGGEELIQYMNTDWDVESRDALREHPVIFDNLLAQKTSGMYGKIIEELSYQRSLGHMVGVPFLKAYHQVGEALDKAGAFKTLEPSPEQQAKPVAIDTGSRKAAQKKNVQPNQQVSSSPQPTVVGSNIDYETMSDEDFLKLAAPE